MGLIKNRHKKIFGDELLDVIPAVLTALAAGAAIAFIIIKNLP